jgi:hypothetical protein
VNAVDRRFENLKRRRCLPHGWPPDFAKVNIAETIWQAKKDVYRWASCFWS